MWCVELRALWLRSGFPYRQGEWRAGGGSGGVAVSAELERRLIRCGAGVVVRRGRCGGRGVGGGRGFSGAPREVWSVCPRIWPGELGECARVAEGEEFIALGT